MQEDTPSQASFYGRSFMIIAGGYIVYFFCLVLMSAGVYAIAFPEQGKNLFLPPDDFEELKRTNPEQIVPGMFQGVLVALNVICALVMGWLVPRLAPFGKFGHGVFFALVIAATWFQLGTGEDSLIEKWVLLTNIVVSPILILVVTNKSVGNIKPEDEHAA